MGEYMAQCKECEYLYHCYGHIEGRKINDGETSLKEVSYWYCSYFYPEVI